MRRVLRGLAPLALALLCPACDGGGSEDAAPDLGPAQADAGLPPDGDADGDGLSNAAEAAGWWITVDDSGFGLDRPEFVVQRRVVSDPALADTDGDGLSDAEERRLKTDPTRADTDGDGLSDADEVRRWGTAPISVDTDGDARNPEAGAITPPNAALFDGAELALDAAGEPAPEATNPASADTDGDGVADGAELRDPLRSPVRAELPAVAIELVDAVDVRLIHTYADSVGVETSYGVTLESSESEGGGRSEGDSSTWGVEGTVSGSVGFDGSNVGVGAGGSATGSYSETTSTDTTAEVAYAMSQAVSEAETTSRAREVTTERGAISLGLRVRNPSDVAYEVVDLGVTVRQFLPTEGRFRALTTLQPPPGFDGFGLPPGGASPVIPFVDDQVDPGAIEALFTWPASLVLEPAGYELLGAGGANFGFTTEGIYSRTALVVVDPGEGDGLQARVAVTVARTPDGAPAGRTVAQALDVLGVPWATAPGPQGQTQLTTVDGLGEALAEGEPPTLDDPAYPEGVGPGRRTRTGRWVVLIQRARAAGPEPAVDFEALRLWPGDAVRLVYLRDRDRDGVSDREERMRGAADFRVHSDGDPDDLEDVGDGLSDFFEQRVGWQVQVAGQAPYPVWSNPVLRDSDGDGLDDRAEYEAGLDPLRPDTDGDGALDPDDPQPLQASRAPRIDGWRLRYAPSEGGTGLGQIQVQVDVSDPDGDLVRVVGEVRRGGLVVGDPFEHDLPEPAGAARVRWTVSPLIRLHQCGPDASAGPCAVHTDCPGGLEAARCDSDRGVCVGLCAVALGPDYTLSLLAVDAAGNQRPALLEAQR